MLTCILRTTRVASLRGTYYSRVEITHNVYSPEAFKLTCSDANVAFDPGDTARETDISDFSFAVREVGYRDFPETGVPLTPRPSYDVGVMPYLGPVALPCRDLPPAPRPGAWSPRRVNHALQTSGSHKDSRGCGR